jgi:hypothetical protein
MIFFKNTANLRSRDDTLTCLHVAMCAEGREITEED